MNPFAVETITRKRKNTLEKMWHPQFLIQAKKLIFLQCYQEMKFCCCYHRHRLEFLVDDRYFWNSSFLLEHHLCSHVLFWFVVILFFFNAAINFRILGCLQLIEEWIAEWKPSTAFFVLGRSFSTFFFFNIPKTHWIKWIFSPCSFPHHANIVSVYVSNKESSFFFLFLVR